LLGRGLTSHDGVLATSVRLSYDTAECRSSGDACGKGERVAGECGEHSVCDHGATAGMVGEGGAWETKHEDGRHTFVVHGDLRDVHSGNSCR
jgi:hypothetical protein